VEGWLAAFWMVVITKKRKKVKEVTPEAKLEYQCSKAVTQAVKKAKAFLAQKHVRVLKQQESSAGDGAGSPPPLTGASATATLQLSLLKSKHPRLENGAIVRRALRSIGLPMGTSRVAGGDAEGEGAQGVAQLERQILNAKAIQDLLKLWDERCVTARPCPPAVGQIAITHLTRPLTPPPLANPPCCDTRPPVLPSFAAGGSQKWRRLSAWHGMGAQDRALP